MEILLWKKYSFLALPLSGFCFREHFSPVCSFPSRKLYIIFVLRLAASTCKQGLFMIKCGKFCEEEFNEQPVYTEENSSWFSVSLIEKMLK